MRGRDFNAGDQANSPWVARGERGVRARRTGPARSRSASDLTFKFYNKDGELPREVVGVVADTPQYRGETEVQPLIYALHRQQLVRQRASLEVQRMQMAFVHPHEGRPAGARRLGARRARARRSRDAGDADAHRRFVS